MVVADRVHDLLRVGLALERLAFITVIRSAPSAGRGVVTDDLRREPPRVHAQPGQRQDRRHQPAARRCRRAASSAPTASSTSRTA